MSRALISYVSYARPHALICRCVTHMHEVRCHTAPVWDQMHCSPNGAVLRYYYVIFYFLLDITTSADSIHRKSPDRHTFDPFLQLRVPPLAQTLLPRRPP